MAPKDNKTGSEIPEVAVAYQKQVREILRAEREKALRKRKYTPAVSLTLTLQNHRQPKTPAELSAEERAQLAPVWHPIPLEQALANPENEIEVADLVDENGVARYTLYAWNYGGSHLFAVGGKERLAYSAQHDVFPERGDLRDLFYAIDQALARAPEFQQPLYFPWDNDEIWADLDPNA